MNRFLSSLRVFLGGLTGLVGLVAWLARTSLSVVDAPSAPADRHAAQVLLPAPKRTQDERGGRGRKTRRAPRARLALVSSVVALGVAGGVFAFFTAGSAPGDGGAAQAGAMPAGSEPVAVGADRDVNVSWAQNAPTFLGGLLGNDTAGAGGYLITRYASGDGDPVAAGDDCDGLQRGAADPLGCAETGLATGRWEYTVTPKYQNWLGAESDRSGAAIVAPEPATAVTLVNGGGVDSEWVNQANEGSVSVDVSLPATSLAGDTVNLTISDGTNDVSASAPASAGAGTVGFTGLDAGGLDDGDLTFTATVVSSYGDSSGATSSTYGKDATSPTVVVSPDRAPDHNGWYNAQVTLSTSPGSSDAGSGLQTCDADVVYSGPAGTGFEITLECVDNAGNTADATSDPFDFDDSDPVVTAVTPDRAPDHNGWYNAPVTWSAAGTDATSGIDTCESVAYPGPDGADLTVLRPCTDEAGNTAGGSSPAFDFDDTNPEVTLTADRGTDHNTWYNAPVLWTPSQTDTTSGPDTCEAAVNYTGPDSVTASVTRTCTDAAGNVGSATEDFKFDDTNPDVNVLPARAPDHNGWYNAPVSFSASTSTDATSGIASCDGSVNYSAPDGTGLSISRSCTDDAGNSANGTSATFKFDNTNPTATLSLTAAGSASMTGTTISYKKDETVTADRTFRIRATVTDTTSGSGSASFPAIASSGWTHAAEGPITTPAGGPYDSSPFTWSSGAGAPGSRTITFADDAGNSATQSVSFAEDTNGPVLQTLEMFDVDGDGRVDRVVATFGETLRACTAPCTTGVSLSSVPSNGTLDSVTISGNQATFNITEGSGALNTSVGSFKVTHKKENDGPIRDLTGNRADFDQNPADKAAPVATALEMRDNDTDGRIDRLVAVFTETLAGSSNTAQWTLANVPSGGTIGSVSTGGTNTATVVINEGAGAHDTAVGSFTVALAASGSGIRDSFGNQSSFVAQAPLDKAGPVAISITDTNGLTDGRMESGDTLIVTFSEAIATAVAGSTVVEADPSGSGSDTLNIPGLTNGARSTGSNDYVTTNSSSVTYSGSTLAKSNGDTTITATVGSTCSGCANLGTAPGAASFNFQPASSLVDAAGNAAAGTLTVTIRLF